MHIETKRRPYNIGDKFDAAAGKYKTCRPTIRDALLLRLRSSVMRLPSCLCGGTRMLVEQPQNTALASTYVHRWVIVRTG